MKLVERLSAIAAELSADGIAKTRNNQQQNYKFRGIDDVYNALSRSLSKHGVVIIPNVLSREQVERVTKTGGVLFYTSVQVEYLITDGETELKAVTYGEAMDSADKSTNKAMSAAYKYMALQLFCIPTEGDNDADNTTPEPVQPRKAPIQQQQHDSVNHNSKKLKPMDKATFNALAVSYKNATTIADRERLDNEFLFEYDVTPAMIAKWDEAKAKAEQLNPIAL